MSKRVGTTDLLRPGRMLVLGDLMLDRAGKRGRGRLAVGCVLLLGEDTPRGGGIKSHPEPVDQESSHAQDW